MPKIPPEEPTTKLTRGVYLQPSPTQNPLSTCKDSAFISADQAIRVISRQPAGLLFDKSLIGQMAFATDGTPSCQHPYWKIRIYSKSASSRVGALGTISWAVVDARTGEFTCAWTEYGKLNAECFSY